MVEASQLKEQSCQFIVTYSGECILIEILDIIIVYRIAGNFRVVQIFAFSGAEQKLKLGETPRHWYFTCKDCGGCGIETRILQPRTFFSEGLLSHSAKICTLENFPLYRYNGYTVVL